MNKQIILLIVCNILYIVGMPLLIWLDIIEGIVIPFLMVLVAIGSIINALIHFRNYKTSAYLYIIGYLLWFMIVGLFMFPLIRIILY